MVDIWTYDIETEEIAIIAFIIIALQIFRFVFLLENAKKNKRKTRDSDAALEHHQDALEADRDIGYRKGEAIQLGNIGNVYFQKGDLNTARDYYKVALKIDREIGYKQGEAIDLGNIGNVYLEKGDPETALEYYQDALKIARETGYKQGETTALKNIAIAYRKMEDPHKAQEYQKEADKMKRKKGTLGLLADLLFWDFGHSKKIEYFTNEILPYLKKIRHYIEKIIK